MSAVSEGRDFYPRMLQRMPVKARQIGANFIFIVPLALLLAWIGVWLINLQLRTHQSWNPTMDTSFWIVMKLLIWIAPVLLFIHFVERAHLSQFLELRNGKQGLLWGGLAGLLLTGMNWVIAAFFSTTRFHAPALSLILMNAVVIAPIVEEITLRGFLLHDLQWRGVPFWLANAFTSITFVLLHLPGWYFSGKLFSSAGFGRSILYLAALSVLLGWLKCRSGSLYAPLLAYTLNNIYSSLLASP
jgi:membrane protease YdiL (CAAX protease family)